MGHTCRGRAGAAAAAASLPSVAGPRAPHLQPDPGGEPNPATVDAALRLGGELQRLFTVQYGGMTLGARNSIINVYETCASDQMTRFAIASAPVDAIRFRFVPHTSQELRRAFDDVAAAQARLGRLGVEVASWGPTSRATSPRSRSCT